MDEDKPGAKPTIVPRPNGPLLVKGLGQMRNSRGEALEVRETLALCRCGQSANKPFCDSTHRKIGFSDANTAADGSADKVDRYEGPELTILDNRYLCAHAGTCTDGLAEVFRYGTEPWIDPAGSKADRIQEAVRACPSGALAFALGGSETRDFDRDPAITIARNGPYYVVGGIDLETDAWGQGASREHYALCRCGQSKRKPFCDGSHWEVEFTDEKN
ncbi:MAG TPA: CDGSH iron-sulfur domain-containing protein [bacterium]|nr:CDGSH iron-sulfur domain-containing protein [bacterium]